MYANIFANINQLPRFKFYPCMPYAHKYANAVTEHGLLGALQRFLPQRNKFARFGRVECHCLNAM